MHFLWGYWLMKYVIKISCIAASFVLVSCGSFDGVDNGAKPVSASDQMQASANSDVPIKLGSQFMVGTTTYTPVDVASYDDVGYASYYGKEFAGKSTANGEIFAPSAVSGAHKTLPMPTYVEVTSLDTGRTILVRVNDRGPMANDRLIDLSEGAARQLGILELGVAGVRVRKVNPPEQERSVLRAGLSAPERIETPESLLRVLRNKLAELPKPQPLFANSTTVALNAVTKSSPSTKQPDNRFIREGVAVPEPAPAPVKPEVAPKAGIPGYVVQMAAFSSKSRADILAEKLDAKVVASGDGKIYRVQYGPYASEQEANSGLEKAKKRGYPQARLYKQ